MKSRVVWFALPFVPGFALWRAPYYARGTKEVALGKYDNHDLARRDALKKLSRLMQIYPFKSRLVVKYQYFDDLYGSGWEMNYERTGQIFTHLAEMSPQQYVAIRAFKIAPERIERAAKWNQTSKIDFVYPRPK